MGSESPKLALRSVGDEQSDRFAIIESDKSGQGNGADPGDGAHHIIDLVDHKSKVPNVRLFPQGAAA